MAERYLPRLIESARKQTPSFDEIIVCVDASPDSTADVARSLGVTVLENEVNLGCSASKNRALEAATSDWIHFHDADDLLLPNFCRLAHQWMIADDPPDVVLFDFEYRDEDTGELLGTSNFSRDGLRNDPVRYAILHQINPFCGLYRRNPLVAIGGYDTEPEILYNEDVAFHCKLALHGFTFDVEKERSVVNYRTKDSMSESHPLQCLQAQYAVMNRVASSAADRYPKDIAQKLWTTASGLSMYSDWRTVDQALSLAIRIYAGIPLPVNTGFRLLCRSFGPKIAFRIREHLIRMLKPGLRRNRFRHSMTS